MTPVTSKNNENPFAHQSGAFLTLLFANLLTIGLFIQSNGSMIQVLWIYWLQSVIIGVINVARILSTPLAPLVKSGNDQLDPSAPPAAAPGIMNLAFAAFFIMHYGMFHLVYAVFLFAFTAAGSVDLGGVDGGRLGVGKGFSVLAVLVSGLAFAIHHGISYAAEKRHYKDHPHAVVSSGKLIAAPYSRIWPMHLIIIFGPLIVYATNTNYAFIAFMLMKTIADLALYSKGVSHPGKGSKTSPGLPQ